MPRSSGHPRHLFHLVLSSLLFAVLFTTYVPRAFQPSHHSFLGDAPDVHATECRFASVTLSPSCGSTTDRLPQRQALVTAPSSLRQPCVWHVSVVSSRRPHRHRLVAPPTNRVPEALPLAEVQLLYRLDGCSSVDSCNASTPCSYGDEDPSDAFWLRAYNHSSKFVVLLQIGLASLVFFVAAIIVDGSIFYPHRPGLALASASVLIMLALAALLYVLLVPYDMQFALYGEGVWDSIAYIFIVMLIAALLPAFAVIWISCVLFFIFLVSFLFELVVLLVCGTLHFLAVLFIYQVANTALHVRLVYFPDDHGDDDGSRTGTGSDEGDGEYDRQLLTMGETFMRRVHANWFIQRVPRMIQDRATQIMHNHMPDHVREQIIHDQVAQIDFEDLEDERLHSTVESTVSADALDGESEAAGDAVSTPERTGENATEATPLLQVESVP